MTPEESHVYSKESQPEIPAMDYGGGIFKYFSRIQMSINIRPLWGR